MKLKDTHHLAPDAQEALRYRVIKVVEKVILQKLVENKKLLEKEVELIILND